MSTQEDAMKALMGMITESDRTTVSRNLNYGERSRGGVDAMSTSEQPMDRQGIRNYMLNGDFSANGGELSPDEMRRAEMEARSAGAGNINFIQTPIYDMNQPQYQNPGQPPAPGGYPPPPYAPPYGYQQPYPPQYPPQYAPYPPQPAPVGAPPQMPQQVAPAQQPRTGSEPIGNRPRPTPKNAAEAVYQLYDDLPASLQRIESNQMMILRRIDDLANSVANLASSFVPQDGETTPGESFRGEDSDADGDVSAEDVVSSLIPDRKASALVESK